jgi:hypothetical protein
VSTFALKRKLFNASAQAKKRPNGILTGSLVQVLDPSKTQVFYDDIAQLVAERPHRSGYPGLRGIRSEIHFKVTVLTGTVATFQLKQLAQEFASHTPGVRQIDDRVLVMRSVRHRRLAPLRNWNVS